MTAQNFETALAHVFKVEGGYADHPSDPGGATNFGITRATLASWRGKPVSKAEVKALTRAEAASIYRANYWDKVKGDDLPSGVDLAMFDHAVHSGPNRAIRNLQGALRVTVDGIQGPQTAAALNTQPADIVIRAMTSRRMALLERLPTWKTFGRGWTRRVNDTQAAALELAKTIQPVVYQAQEQHMTEAKPLFASRTIWGALIAIVAQLMLMSGYSFSSEAQSVATDLVTQLVGVGGAFMAMWGRVVAFQQIR